MATQTFTFVVLPNGTTAQGGLLASVYFAPRLDQGATLADFPDMVQWTRSLATHGLEFELECNGQSVVAPIDRSVLRPAVWSSIFKPTTLVQPFALPDFTKQLVISYPVRDAMTYLKYAFQQFGYALAFPPQGEDGRGQYFLRELLLELVFRRGEHSNLDAALSELRVAMWREQQARKPAGGGILVAVPRGRLSGAETRTPAPPDGIPTTLTRPTTTRPMIGRFALFHRTPPAPNRGPLPSSEQDFAQMLDFHKAMTALSSYPALLRALGLVFDLELPAELCPYSPSAPGGDYLTIGIGAVTAGFDWKLEPQYCLPQTAYYRNGTEFAAAPATPSANLAVQNYVPGDIVAGVLALLPQYFLLTQVDVDGALLKAMAYADSVGNMLVRGSQVNVVDVLPSLRSGGIALAASDRAAQLLSSLQSSKAFDDALHAKGSLTRPLNAMDVTRGFRIDIWSSQDRQWHSLHRRDGAYEFSQPRPMLLNTVDEEGFIQLSVTQPADDPTRKNDPVAQKFGVPQPGQDVRLHERVVKWEGWSLSVPRPGGVLNRSPDPSQALDADPTMNQPVTPFKMVASFEPVKGSLPRLRFGARYRLRARAVDLAGNSVPFDAHSPAEVVAPVSGQLPYFRFEPVPIPVLALRNAVKRGGSLDRLVIRSFNTKESLDGVRTHENDQRHVAPPKTAVRMAEQHGMFDAPNGTVRGDFATYDLIIKRDKGNVPSRDKIPWDANAQLQVTYFPDPLARGVAFQDLPNTPDDTVGEAAGGKLQYRTFPDVFPESGSVTRISFGEHWPDRKAFRIVLVEGSGAPAWNAEHRVLTLGLPKAGVAQVTASCYLTEEDLTLMGVWNWLREFVEAQQAAAMVEPNAFADAPYSADQFALLTRLVLNGGHPMITPGRNLVMVHAVQQPLGRPTFVLLPITHQTTPNAQASALGNKFDPITAWRPLNSHYAVLLGGLRIHGMSTAQVDLSATWQEYLDEATQPLPSIVPATAHVDTIELANEQDDLSALSSKLIPADALNSRYTAYYLQPVDTLWFCAPFDSLPGVTPSPSVLAAPLHRFSDTKHRRVYYEATATSRFREYFPPATKDFTRTSDRLLVNVPSSNRPAAPNVAYVLPTFGIERQETTNVKTDIRVGNGVRVYLHRPWYSSGEGELLGVVLWPVGSQAPQTPDREKYKHYITQWGLDPIWETESLPEMPNLDYMDSPAAQGTGLNLEETTISVDVAGYEVGFDENRKLWYCDIGFSNPLAYKPFVRLALARYQPSSLPGVELSHVALADFVQLAPNRSAVLSLDPADPRRARVFVAGIAPQGPNRSIFLVTVEQRTGNISSDLAWGPAPDTAAVVTEDAPAPLQPNAVLWSGTILFSSIPGKNQFRVVIRECEQIPRDLSLEELELKIFPMLGLRVVYAAIIPCDFPSHVPPGKTR